MSSDSKQLLNLYALFGDDDLKRFERRNKLQTYFEHAGMAEFDRQSFKKSTQSISEFLNACNSISFSGSLRLVELVVDSELTKDEIDQLVNYIHAPFEQTVVLFSFSSLPKNSRIYKALATYNPKSLISCESPKKYELASLVQNQALAYNLKLNKECAQLIVERLGDNRFLIETMLKKLALRHGADDSHTVSPEEILESIPETNQTKPWDVVNACCARNVEHAIRSFRKMPEDGIFPLMSLMAKQIRELIVLKSCLQEGIEPNQLLKLPDWKLKQYRTCASQFSIRELWHMHSELIACERLYKSAPYKALYFESWIFKHLPRKKS